MPCLLQEPLFKLLHRLLLVIKSECLALAGSTSAAPPDVAVIHLLVPFGFMDNLQKGQTTQLATPPILLKRKACGTWSCYVELLCRLLCHKGYAQEKCNTTPRVKRQNRTIIVLDVRAEDNMASSSAD
jgi:hypothetical protein